MSKAIGSASGRDLPRSGDLDHEESWLRFNEHVLGLAEDENVPLLERVRFLATFASKLDEFFMGRAARVGRPLATGTSLQTATRNPPRQVRERTFEVSGQLMLRHAACYSERVLPALTAHGIHILQWSEQSDIERRRISRLFCDRIYPMLTPLVVDAAHPFPYISGLSLNLAVVVADPQRPGRMFARVKVPPPLPRLLEVSPHRFVLLEDVIAAHLPRLFHGTEILEHHVFRVTRSRDPNNDEDVAGEVMRMLGHVLSRRTFGAAVRLEVEDSISPGVLERLVTELGIGKRGVYKLPGPLDLAGLHSIADLDLPELKYQPSKVHCAKNRP